MKATKVKIDRMNPQQQISFFSQAFDLEEEFEWEDDLTEENLGKLLLRLGRRSLTKRFPDEYLFVGDRYFDSEESMEEATEDCVEKDLPLLGDCKVFPQLKRIVYVKDNFYAEDYDVPPISHPETRRMSYHEYQAKVRKEIDKLEEALKSFEQ